MRSSVLSAFLVCWAAIFTGCVTNQVLEPGAVKSAVNASCGLTESELAALQRKAMDYLLDQWPVLDRRCERMTDRILANREGECAIVGRPIVNNQCEAPSHKEYQIVFLKGTLEPTQIFWMGE